MSYNWKPNIWTGHYIAEISPTRRLIRQDYQGKKPLYRAEEWGDHSLKYPIKGPWMDTPKQSIKALDERIIAIEEGREVDE